MADSTLGIVTARLPPYRALVVPLHRPLELNRRAAHVARGPPMRCAADLGEETGRMCLLRNSAAALPAYHPELRGADVIQ